MTCATPTGFCATPRRDGEDNPSWKGTDQTGTAKSAFLLGRKSHMSRLWGLLVKAQRQFSPKVAPAGYMGSPVPVEPCISM